MDTYLPTQNLEKILLPWNIMDTTPDPIDWEIMYDLLKI